MAELKVSTINLAFGNSDTHSTQFVETFADKDNYPEILECAFLGFQEVRKDSGKSDLPEYLRKAGYDYTHTAERKNTGNDEKEWQSVFSMYPYTGYHEELIHNPDSGWQRKWQRVLLPARKNDELGYFRIYHYHNTQGKDREDRYRELCERAKCDGEEAAWNDLGSVIFGDMNLTSTETEKAIFEEVFEVDPETYFYAGGKHFCLIVSKEPGERVVPAQPGFIHPDHPDDLEYYTDHETKLIARFPSVEVGVDPRGLPFFTELSETTQSGPALTKKGGRLYLIWRATTDHVVYATSSDGGFNWTGSYRFTDEFKDASGAVTAAVFDDKVYASWRGKDSTKFRVDHSSGPGEGITVKDTNGDAQKSESRPCLTANDKYLFVFWRSTSNHIVYAWASDGKSWSGDTDAAPDSEHNSSKSGPAAGVLANGDRVMVYRAKSDERLMYTARRGGEWQESLQVGGVPYKTESAPAVVGTSRGFVVCWRNKGDQKLVFIEYIDGSGWGQAQVVTNPFDGTACKTSDPPSLCNDDGAILVAWKDKDSKNICVATTGLWI